MVAFVQKEGVSCAVAAEAEVGKPTRIRERLNDKEILMNLKALHGWRNQDKGSNGNCLFLSIAPQVTPEDLQRLTERPLYKQSFGGDLSQQWQAMSTSDRVRLLRKTAMLDEAEFVTKLASLLEKGEEVPPDVEWRATEFFTDMAEEFISTNRTELAANIPGWDLKAIYSRVRQVKQQMSKKEIYSFVVRHAEEYMASTGRDGNWAGSSEMVALASALRRPFAAYGNNWISQEDLELVMVGEGTWEVQPYFATPPAVAESSAEPIRVFQVGGGGHYQMLA